MMTENFTSFTVEYVQLGSKQIKLINTPSTRFFFQLSPEIKVTAGTQEVDGFVSRWEISRIISSNNK